MSFYKYITEESRTDSNELKNTMEEVVLKLKKHNTDEIKPGILLGMIQSGKTRAFTGIIAKCFDEGYDLTIIFTKNSVALVEQTIKRLRSEFRRPVEASRLYIWDVIKLQEGQLTGYILREKNIIIVKKEQKNLNALEVLFNDIQELKNKKILIVDDEADQASVSFATDKSKPDGFDLGSVSKSISKLRAKLKKGASFLQVTATPYSLYLQPEHGKINFEEYSPQRPVFTELLRPHDAYIGGEYYFEKSLDLASPASYMHVQVDKEELKTLNFVGQTNRYDYDQRLKDNLLNTKNLKVSDHPY
ncbi:MAG: DEAD/DEAH box helicase family protein [Chitinophagaceae bacterium]|nr:DEAD/DEAH box helicase family protein [Chitinophagaceae bacterium]